MIAVGRRRVAVRRPSARGLRAVGLGLAAAVPVVAGLLACGPEPLERGAAARAAEAAMPDTPRVPPGNESTFTDLPGVPQFQSLAPELALQVVDRANAALCECGCVGHSVNTCLHEREACPVARKLASGFVDDALAYQYQVPALMKAAAAAAARETTGATGPTGELGGTGAAGGSGASGATGPASATVAAGATGAMPGAITVEAGGPPEPTGPAPAAPATAAAHPGAATGAVARPRAARARASASGPTGAAAHGASARTKGHAAGAPAERTSATPAVKPGAAAMPASAPTGATGPRGVVRRSGRRPPQAAPPPASGTGAADTAHAPGTRKPGDHP